MGDYEAFTVTKENIEDDRALLQTGLIIINSQYKRRRSTPAMCPKNIPEHATFCKLTD